MKKLVVLILMCFAGSSLLVGTASAHPGNTDKNGGHTCRTNCAKWGYATGSYHYHNPKRTTPTPPPALKPILPTAPKDFVGIPKTKTDLYNCKVVGNGNSKIYHLKGSSHIKNMDLKKKECFTNEKDAVRKGYRKSKT